MSTFGIVATAVWLSAGTANWCFHARKHQRIDVIDLLWLPFDMACGAAGVAVCLFLRNDWSFPNPFFRK